MIRFIKLNLLIRKKAKILQKSRKLAEKKKLTEKKINTILFGGNYEIKN